MRSIEQSGKSVAEATQQALAILGVSERDVDVEVLWEGGEDDSDEPSDARVRVSVREQEAAPAPPAAGERQDPGEVAREVLQRILRGMGLENPITLEPLPDDAYRLEIVGDNLGVIIGKQGSTINALQYLVGLIAHKRVGARVRVIVDAEGYRSRREQSLIEMARSYADQVRQTGQEAVLDALQSYERRIIHTALVDDPDVQTYSEGEEPDRRVVISPREESRH